MTRYLIKVLYKDKHKDWLCFCISKPDYRRTMCSDAHRRHRDGDLSVVGYVIYHSDDDGGGCQPFSTWAFEAHYTFAEAYRYLQLHKSFNN